jgi:predicted transcriptional regulator
LTNNFLGTTKSNSQQFPFTILKRNREWNNSKGSRRARLDILAEILLYCEQPRTKTSVMYNTNLNHAQLKKHMKTLITQKLLEKSVNKYFTTERGYHFLELFVQLNNIIEKTSLGQFSDFPKQP